MEHELENTHKICHCRTAWFPNFTCSLFVISAAFQQAIFTVISVFSAIASDGHELFISLYALYQCNYISKSR